MAATITHLAVAKRIIERLPEGTIRNELLFYAGSIAPDAIHARENYIREFKKRTHFTTGISGDQFIKKENQLLFHERVQQFITDYIVSSNADFDLYRGYIVHVLTDEIFNLTIREEFADKMAAIGIAQHDRIFFNLFMNDNDINDRKTALQFKNLDQLFTMLQEMEPYEIRDYLTEEELAASRDWVIRKYAEGKKVTETAAYISYERINEFIEEASMNVVTRLTDGISFSKLF
ncbi:MAG: hypothetical protein JXQ23_06960 [Clostridia bacterium]|nr:hypothetical protein [Clostridia bacterium]